MDGMELLARPHKDCQVIHEGRYVRALVGAAESPEDVHECYRALIYLAIQHRFDRALVVGEAADDPLHHLAARDGIIALHQIGVPAGFKIAFVPRTAETLNAYRHAEIEAKHRGIRARVLFDEEEAIAWLAEEDKH
jgi:hypothetical protein